jgi:hypothetical protein
MRLLVTLALVLAVSACERNKAAPAPPATATSTSALSKSPAKVARIVFIDKEHACDCTRKRTEDTWAAMQAALGTPASLPVERLHVDTQVNQAQAYTAAKPLMVPPGIYFVDASNGVVDMLQGEVTTEQIAAALKGR